MPLNEVSAYMYTAVVSNPFEDLNVCEDPDRVLFIRMWEAPKVADGCFRHQRGLMREFCPAMDGRLVSILKSRMSGLAGNVRLHKEQPRGVKVYLRIHREKVVCIVT